MFGLTDTSVLHTLYEKSLQEIPTQIFYDPTASLFLDTKIQKLEAKPMECEGLLHQKLLVLDDSLVFLGSANLTRSSLNMHDNLMMGLFSPQIASFLKEKAPYSQGHLKTRVAGQDIEIWLLPDPRGHALQTIRHLIRKAHKSLKLAMFTLTHPLLLEELSLAHKRGVELSIVVDHQSGMGASSKAVEFLQKKGISVRFSSGMNLLHHKFLYVDEKNLLLGSANWTKAAFHKNRDLFAILYHLNSSQKQFMEKLWTKILYESKQKP